jgi:WD40-like Beta Propeller Repeat
VFIRSLLLPILPASLFLALSFVACDESKDGERSTPVARADAGDAQTPSIGPLFAADDINAPCRLRPWATPRRVEIVSTPLEEGAPSLTANELAIVFDRSPLDGGTRHELWTAKRDTPAAPFSTPERLTGASSDADDAYPALTSDGVTLVFASRRLDEAGPYRLFRAERPDVTVSFNAATPIASPDAGSAGWPAGSAIYPFLTPDRTRLYFAADKGDGFYRIHRSERLANGEVGAPVREESVDDAKSSLAFVMSADRLTLFVSRSNGDDRYLIHSAVRASINDPFGPLLPVDALNAGAVDARVGWLSPDGCRSYLTRRSALGDGGADDNVDIYESER